MTKEVMLSIRGLAAAAGDTETLESLVPGTYYYKNNGHYLLFEEYEEGVSEPTKSSLHYKDGELTLTRRGAITTQMEFLLGKKTVSSYRTPFGMLTLGIDTRELKAEETDNTLTIEVCYGLEVNYEHLADQQIRIHASSRKGNAEGFVYQKTE